MYEGPAVKHLFHRGLHFSSLTVVHYLHPSFFVRFECPFLRPAPHIPSADARRRRQDRPSLRYRLSLRRRQAVSLRRRARRHAGGVGTMFEGSPLSGTRRARTATLYSVGPIRQGRTRTMMHACASAARLRGGGPILDVGAKAMTRHGTPPPRTVIASPPDMICQDRAAKRMCEAYPRTVTRPASASPPARHLHAQDARVRLAACAPRR